MNVFDPNLIDPQCNAYWRQCRDLDLVTADQLYDYTPSQDLALQGGLEGKLLKGILLAVSFPNKKSFFSGTKFTFQSDGTNKAKMPTKQHSVILIYGDLCNVPQCFALAFKTRTEIQTKFKPGALIDKMKVGAVHFIYEPGHTNQTLGRHMPLFANITQLAPAVPHRISQSSHLVPSDGTEHQNFFVRHGVSIVVNRAMLATSSTNPDIACNLCTCDLQTSTCANWCFGSHTSSRPIALQADIYVRDIAKYDPNGTISSFVGFRSRSFAELFTINLGVLSNQPSTALQDGHFHATLRNNIKEMTEIINNNGGFTIVGWHKLGIIAAGTDDERPSVTTEGHLVVLSPTNLQVLDRQDFKHFLISTPDDMLHRFPPLNGVGIVTQAPVPAQRPMQPGTNGQTLANDPSAAATNHGPHGTQHVLANSDDNGQFIVTATPALHQPIADHHDDADNTGPATLQPDAPHPIQHQPARTARPSRNRKRARSGSPAAPHVTLNTTQCI